MINSYISQQIERNFPYKPTDDQFLALHTLTEFLLSEEPDSLLLMKGYAGTGKTSLVGALVKTLNELKQKTFLLAPTGRAAKVFSGYAGQKAYTIHKKIYRQRAFSNEPTGFMPADNLHKDTLFIVDEASMIANEGLDSFVFGFRTSVGRFNPVCLFRGKLPSYPNGRCRTASSGDANGESRLESRDITGLQPTGLGDSVNSSRTPKRGLGNPVRTRPGYETHYETTRSRSFRNYN